MSKKKVIDIKDLPTRPPTILTIALVALLKAYEASDVVWAVAITLLVLAWIALLVAHFQEERTPVKFKD